MLALAVAALLSNSSVATVDPLTLRPRGAVVRLRADPWTWSWSPDRRRVAFTVGNRHTRIQVVDVARKRTTAVYSISHRTWFPWLSWTPSGRLLAFGADGTIVAADPAGRVLRRAHLDGWTVGDDVVAAGDGAVVLLGGARGSTLAVVSSDATIRRIPVPRIKARPDGVLWPGLTADATTAYIASATRDEVVSVDLATGATATHVLAAPGVAVAVAAKDDTGSYREIAALGNGMLALAGYDMRRGRIRRALGLRFVDTRTWSARMADPAAPYFQPGGPGVLLGEFERSGISAYSPDGTRLYSRLKGREVAVAASGSYVYARTLSPHHRTRVLDARTGRTLHVLHTALLPRLL